MNQLGIIHPGMMTKLGATGIYPETCTFQNMNETQDSYGQPIADPQNVAGLVDLTCRLSPLTATERRTLEQEYATATHHLALAGHYPAATSAMQVVVDGTAYNVLGVEHDGNGETTRAYLETVT